MKFDSFWEVLPNETQARNIKIRNFRSKVFICGAGKWNVKPNMLHVCSAGQRLKANTDSNKLYCLLPHCQRRLLSRAQTGGDKTRYLSVCTKGSKGLSPYYTFIAVRRRIWFCLFKKCRGKFIL